MKNFFKMFNKAVLIYTLIIWLILNVFGIQNMYFYGGEITTTIVVKILHIFFIYLIIGKIYSLYEQRNTPKGKNEIIISSICFVILMSLLFSVWPGTWSWDDITILKNASFLNLTPWQHFLSGLFQILCLQTIPIPSGVAIVQIIIASLIVGYCITNISILYGKSKKQVIVIQIILGLITLLPPLILYILSGFRMGIYSYLELLLITKMIILYKDKKEITFKESFKISLLTIIISVWRTEALYYPLFILVLFFILGKQVVRKKSAIIAFIMIMVANIYIGKVNNLMIGNNNYSLTATMETVTSIIKISDESDKKELEAINNIIDVNYILENPEKTGELYYWTNGLVRNYTEEQYSNYLKAYLKLAIKYPDVTFKSLWNIFMRAGSGFGEDGKQTTKNMVAHTGGETLDLFNLTKITGTRWNAISVADSRVKRAINENLRENVILFLNGTDSNGNLTIVHNIFWNLFIPFSLILICLIYKIIKKDWFMVFSILTVVVRIPIVFVTAPAEYFMYYLSAYLCAYIISAIIIIETIIQIKYKKTRGLLCEKKS